MTIAAKAASTPGPHLGERAGRLGQPEDDGLERVAGFERVRSRDGLVERDAEGVEVRAAVELLALRLLRGDVGRRAEEEAGLGLHERTGRLRDAEVHQERTALAVEDDVLGLDVAVDDPAGVAVLERVEEGNRDAGRLSLPKGTPFPHLAREGPPLDELHRVPVDPPGLPEVVDLDDRRVLEGRRETDLLREAPGEVLVDLVSRSEDLQGLAPLQARVPDLVDRGEPAPTELVVDPVPVGQKLLQRPVGSVTIAGRIAGPSALEGRGQELAELSVPLVVVGEAPADHLVGLLAAVDVRDLDPVRLERVGGLLVGEEVVLQPVDERRGKLVDLAQLAVDGVPLEDRDDLVVGLRCCRSSGGPRSGSRPSGRRRGRWPSRRGRRRRAGRRLRRSPRASSSARRRRRSPPRSRSGGGIRRAWGRRSRTSGGGRSSGSRSSCRART